MLHLPSSHRAQPVRPSVVHRLQPAVRHRARTAVRAHPHRRCRAARLLAAHPVHRVATAVRPARPEDSVQAVRPAQAEASAPVAVRVQAEDSVAVVAIAPVAAEVARVEDQLADKCSTQ